MYFSKYPLKILVLSLLPIITISCRSSTSPEKIDSPEGNFAQNPTYKLINHEGMLYAATEGGLFRKALEPGIKDWKSLGLGDATIYTFLVFSRRELLASAAYEDRQASRIVKTSDSGEIWIDFQNGFGGEKKFTPITMDASEANPSVIFARVASFTTVARSTDRGNSWETVVKNWSNPNLGTSTFVKIDPNNPQNIWAGGAQAYFTPFLLKSTDGGQSWQGVDMMGNSEYTLHDIIFHTTQTNILLLGSGAGVQKSTDGGESWPVVLEGIYTSTLTHSARNPDTVYASGINNEKTLFFATSTDFGDSWEITDIPDSPGNIRVNDMVSVMAEGQEVLYLGTNKGVYSYTFK